MSKKWSLNTESQSRKYTEQCDTHDVSKSFYCGNESLNISRCEKQCLICINDMNTETH